MPKQFLFIYFKIEGCQNLSLYYQRFNYNKFGSFGRILMISSCRRTICNIRLTLCHGLINYVDTKAKCRHLKIFTRKGTLWQVFIKSLQTGDIVSHVGIVFSTQLCELLPLSSSLWFNSPPSPLPCVNKYTVTVYTYKVCNGGGGGRYGVLGLRNRVVNVMTIPRNYA